MVQLYRASVACGAVLLTFLAASCASRHASHATAGITSRSEQAIRLPIDHRIKFLHTNFEADGDGEWVTDIVSPPFDFDEMIYSWQITVPDEEGSRIHLRVFFDDGTESPWLYGGYWGEVPLTGERSNPKFEHGYVAMDQLLLDKKANRLQFKVVSEGGRKTTVLPDLYVITTDNTPTQELAERFQPVRAMIHHPPRILDLPLRCQTTVSGEPLSGRCQSASMATALEYYGTSVPTEDISELIYDVEYDYPGIWPRTLGAATQLGYEAYIDRFRDWDRVKDTIAKNNVILCSIKMPEGGDYKSPPYPSITGHIVTLNGVTEDGRVIVTDSALCKRGDASRCQWLIEDFEKVWMKTKGGVGMVVSAPEGAEMKLFPVDRLPAFPEIRPESPE